MSNHAKAISLILAIGLCWAGAGLASARAGQQAEAAGLTLETLAPDELDDIKAETGKRAGVDVIAVRPGSPAAAAGFREGDVLTAVGGTLVDSAAKAAALIRGASGDLLCTVVSANLTTFALETKSLRLRLGGGAAATPAPVPTGGGQAKPPAPTPVRPAVGGVSGVEAASGLDPVNAYFNIMDFACTQAWGRTIATPAADRQRAAAAMNQGWGQMDAASRAQIMAMPKAWADLQSSWKTMSEADRGRKKSEWRDQILLPNNYFAPPAALQTFTAQGNLLGFQFPAAWTGGWQVIDGTPFLFVGPNGQQATWDKVLNTQASPPGALFALVTVSNEMRQMSYVQGARYLVQLLMPGAASSFREVQVIPIGQAGAILVLRGKFPGESAERFYWIGITAFGDSQVFAGRMGGPVSQAMDLLPGFHHVLATLQLNPPQARPSDGYGSWQAAWSRVETASVKYIWANK